MTISEDLRRRIVDLVDTGVSRREAARRFQVSVSSAIRYAKQFAEVGHVATKGHNNRKSRLDPFGDSILAWIAEQPDLTLRELSALLQRDHGLTVPSSTLDDWLRAHKFSFKKNRTRHRTGP